MFLNHLFSKALRSNRRRKASRVASTEALELRTLLTAQPFQHDLLNALTTLPLVDARTTMQAGDWNDDGINDMFLIQRSGTASGKVEVGVYSTQYSYFDARTGGQANYYTALLPVAMNAVNNNDWEFRMDNWGGGSKPDLFAIHKANTASGFVEVTVFTGESNFTTSSSVFQTTLPTAGKDWTFDVGHFNNDGIVDLFAVLRNGAVATELYVESGAGPTVSTAFSTQLLHVNTAMSRTDASYQFVVGDMGNDGVPDLLAIQKYGSLSGRVDVSILSGATSTSGVAPFQWFSTQTATGFFQAGFDWDFDLTDFNTPIAALQDGILDLVGFQKIAVSSPDFHFLSGALLQPTAVFGNSAVPTASLFTSAAQTTNGLTGSYVNSSLRAVSSPDDWRTTQAIVGSRLDSNVNFTTNSLGSRSDVNVTGGSNSNWDFFSVQWDGYISIPADGVSLRTNSSDGSRMWIDINNSGEFGTIGNEYINNGWGHGQDVTLGPASVQLAKGVYKIRIQFEEGSGPNPMQLLWDFSPTAVPVNAYFTDAGKTSPGIVGSYVNTSLRNITATDDWRTSSAVQISGTRVDPSVNFPLDTFGVRSGVGVTSGNDSDWDNFSVQWDGFIVIPANGVHLYTRTDDGSRLWIDVNGDGVFSNTSAEFLNNAWNVGQAVTTSTPSAPLAAGTYRMRMQYEEGYGANAAQLLWDYHPIQKSSSIITGVAASTDQRPVISWTPMTGAGGYDVWINNLTTNTSAVVRTTTPDAWLSTPQDLGIGQFAVWVRPSDINGVVISTWSSRYTFTINSPVTLLPLAASQTTAYPEFNWNPLAGADHYDIWVTNLTTNESPYLRQAVVTTTHTSFSIDMAMGRYRVWVRAFDAKGTAAMWSKPSDFVVAPAPIPLAPLSSTFDRAPTLSWSSVKGASSYQVTLVNQSTGKTAYAITGLISPSWTVPADLTDGTYQWWVSGVSQDGYRSAAPQKNTFFVGGRPTVLTPIGNTSNHQPLFTWANVIQAATYEIWVNRVDVATSAIIHVSGLTLNEYTPTTALPTGTYRVWVRAVSTTGETSIWSAPVDFAIASAADNQWLGGTNGLPDAIVSTGLSRLRPIPITQDAQESSSNEASRNSVTLAQTNSPEEPEFNTNDSTTRPATRMLAVSPRSWVEHHNLAIDPQAFDRVFMHDLTEILLAGS